MRTTLLAIVVALAAVGCQQKADTNVDTKSTDMTDETSGDAKGLEIQAPGVDVEVKPGEGVEVKAPGVEVDAKRGDGAEVDVAPPEPE